jgi:hypothetical protein
MRSAEEGWIGRMPVSKWRQWLRPVIAGCALTLALPALALVACLAGLAAAWPAAALADNGNLWLYGTGPTC